MSDILNDTTKSASLTRLIKLISMSTSSNDGEALVALRMANREAAKFGTWHEILSGKVKVIGDPFADLAPPVSQNRAPDMESFRRPVPTPRQAPPRPAAPPPRPANHCLDCGIQILQGLTHCTTCLAARQAAPKARPTAQPDPFKTTTQRAQPTQPSIKNVVTNRFAGLCQHCNTRVDVGAGEAVLISRGGKDKWLTQHRLDDKACSEYAKRNGKLNNLQDFAAGLGL